jgi:hypothetical protein
MIAWNSDELKRIETAEELDLVSLRSDGTPRKPVTMWVVRVGDEIYVRAYKGSTSPWFRGAQSRHQGMIQAGGVKRHVTFVEVSDADVNDKIDSAYLTKYRRYPTYVAPMVTLAARAATIKLVPRDDRS